MSKFFYKDKPVIGLDISPTSIKLMAVDTKKWTVLGYGSIDLDPTKLQQSMDTDGKYLGEQLQLLLKKKTIGHFRSNHVVMSVPTTRTYSRSVTIPRELKGSILDAVKLEAEQYVPVPLNQIYLDYEITKQDKDSTTVLLCAVPQKTVDTCVDAATRAGLRVVMVEPGMSSVARLLKSTEEGDLATVIVDIGAASTDVAILDGSIKVTGGIAIGGNTFTLDISTKLGVTLEKAHQLKVLNGLGPSPKQKDIKAALEPNLKRVTAEVKKIIRYYSERVTDARKIEQVIIVGGGSNIPGIGDYFTDSIVLATRVASPWQVLNFGKLPQPARQFKARYITVAGLACVKPKEIWR